MSNARYLGGWNEARARERLGTQVGRGISRSLPRFSVASVEVAIATPFPETVACSVPDVVMSFGLTDEVRLPTKCCGQAESMPRTEGNA